MSADVLLRLAGIFIIIAIGWTAGRTGIVGPGTAETLGQAAFNVFTPALLFRTTAGVSLAALPWRMLALYFVPTLILLLVVAGLARARGRTGAAPAVRGLSVTFSNTVQLGIPVVTALFGTDGLALHIAIISLQALILLTTATVLAEHALGSGASMGTRLAQTVRRSLIHPVVLPILLGLTYHATGLGLPRVVDDVLATLGLAVVPLSLVTIGLSLQLYGLRGSGRSSLVLAAGKLLLHPLLVFTATWLFGLHGLPLVVAVVCASLPAGANVLLFALRYDAANRYDTLPAETTAAIVVSTLCFPLTATLVLFAVT